jgi:hypothetical protein
MNVPALLEAGIPLFRSANGVLLSPGLGATGTILPSFIERVLDARTGAVVWPPCEVARAAAAEAAAVGSSTPASHGATDWDGDAGCVALSPSGASVVSCGAGRTAALVRGGEG